MVLNVIHVSSILCNVPTPQVLKQPHNMRLHHHALPKSVILNLRFNVCFEKSGNSNSDILGLFRQYIYNLKFKITTLGKTWWWQPHVMGLL